MGAKIRGKKGPTMTQIYDSIIIGAGVIGASIAFRLAERGLKVSKGV
jgi:glycerol-3-phosphate dehydrogenase